MEVRLDKRYPVEADAGRAWFVLSDIRAVAGCMPGAEITEQTGPAHYKGTVKVKVGPVSTMFNGDIDVLEVDPAARRIRLSAKGSERGGSTATMDLTASLEPDGAERSTLVGSSAVVVSGKLAQFGGRLMGQVSDMILAQFAANFASAAAAQPGPTVATAAPAAGAQKGKELNALAIFWGLVKRWLVGLFGRQAH
jgi:carbon monoxide dehydrogenase subunit G